MSVTLSEFLIGIGFKVASGDLKKFLNAQGAAERSFLTLNNAAKAAAIAVAAATVKMSNDLDKLFFTSQRVKDTASNLAGMAYAAKQVGVGADAAASSIENLASRLRRMPGLQGLLQNMGISPAQGPTQIALQLQQALQKRFPNQQYIQLRYADMFGIDERTYLRLQDMAKFENERNQTAASFGVNLNEAAKDANKLWTEIRRIWMILEVIVQKAVQQATPGLLGIMQSFVSFLISHASNISQGLSALVRWFTAFIGIVARLAVTLAGFLGTVQDWWNSMTETQKRFYEFVMGILVAWRLLQSGLLSTPLGLAITALTALLLLLDDYNHYVKYGRAHSLFDWSKFAGAHGLFRQFGEALKEAGDYAATGWQWLIDIIKVLSDPTWIERQTEMAKRWAGVSNRTDAPGAAPGSSTASQEERANRIAAILTAQGSNLDQSDANAILGNLDQESSLNPGAGAGTAHQGLAQWSAERQRQFEAWAGKPFSQSTLEDQSRFIVWDLSPQGHYASVGSRMRAAQTQDEKTKIFAEGYETPATPGTAAMDAEDAKRQARARYWRGRPIWNDNGTAVTPTDPNATVPWSLPGLLQHFNYSNGQPVIPASPNTQPTIPASPSAYWSDPSTSYGHLGPGGATNTNAMINQNTTIHVHGSGDAGLTAQRVHDQQQIINGRLLRNTRAILT